MTLSTKSDPSLGLHVSACEADCHPTFGGDVGSEIDWSLTMTMSDTRLAVATPIWGAPPKRRLNPA
jgi:hypothetical protein